LLRAGKLIGAMRKVQSRIHVEPCTVQTSGPRVEALIWHAGCTLQENSNKMFTRRRNLVMWDMLNENRPGLQRPSICPKPKGPQFYVYPSFARADRARPHQIWASPNHTMTEVFATAACG